MPEAKESKAAKPSLKSAAAAEDPAVHQLLAERQTATANGDKDALAAVDKALAELGYA